MISFYWSGRAISKSALANVLAWVDRAKGTDWVIVMWSDLAISDWNTNAAGATLTKAGVEKISRRRKCSIPGCERRTSTRGG